MEWRVRLLALCIFLTGCSSEVVKTREYSKTEKALLYLSVANAALLQGDHTGALQSLVQAEALDNSLPGLFHSKALAYFGKHDLETAIASARRAVELSPNFSEANNTLGSLLISGKHYEEAVSPLMTAAQDPLFRDSYKSWTNLGILKFRLKEFNQAVFYFDRAILDAPQRACGAYYYRGQVSQQDQKLNEAIADYQLATKKSCAGFGEAALALGLAYEKKRDYSQARKVFLEIHQRFPNTSLEERAMNQLRYLP